MTSKLLGPWASLPGLFVALALVAVNPWPCRAGDGQVVHVRETTTLILDGRGWKLDGAASRKADLVTVSDRGVSGAGQRFDVEGLTTGQVELVFRSGRKTFHAHIDVLR